MAVLTESSSTDIIYYIVYTCNIYGSSIVVALSMYLVSSSSCCLLNKQSLRKTILSALGKGDESLINDTTYIYMYIKATPKLAMKMPTYNCTYHIHQFELQPYAYHMSNLAGCSVSLKLTPTVRVALLPGASWLMLLVSLMDIPDCSLVSPMLMLERGESDVFLKVSSMASILSEEMCDRLVNL